MQSTSGDIHPLACFISIAIGPAVLSAPPSSQDGLKFVLLRSVGDAHLLFAVTAQCATTQMNLTRIEHVRMGHLALLQFAFESLRRFIDRVERFRCVVVTIS